jgi:glycosyltransferase involved in cell wall biosynthesis
LKRVLYVAYFFPPLGGAGVQRSLKFVRYLPAFGWRATVLTARSGYWMQDPTLLAELDQETRILRAPFYGGGLVNRGTGRMRQAGSRPQPAPRRYRRILALRSVSGFFLVPDAYLGWVLPASRHALSELASAARAGETYEALLTTSSPDSAHLLGRFLKRRTGLPWVADFRDPWTRRMAYAPPTPWHDRLHHALERSCLMEADAIVVTNEETRDDFLRRYTKLTPAKISVIPNGYDEEDFRVVEARRCTSAARTNDGDATESAAGGRCTTEQCHGDRKRLSASLVHAGQLNPERSIEPFLLGLRSFLVRSPQRAHEVSTLFLGGFYDRHVDDVKRLGLDHLVRFEPGRPHLESISALLEARILLLLEQNSDRGRLILPGKIFEYLRAGRPILALVPSPGAAQRVIRQWNAGIVCDPEDPEVMARALERLLDCTEAQVTRADAIAGHYERSVLAGRLAGLLDRVSSFS